MNKFVVSCFFVFLTGCPSQAEIACNTSSDCAAPVPFCDGKFCRANPSINDGGGGAGGGGMIDGIDTNKTTLLFEPTTGLIADGISSTTGTLSLKTVSGTPVSGIAVTVSVSGTDNTLSANAGSTDANGLFRFTLSTTKAQEKIVQVVYRSQIAASVVPFGAGPVELDKSTFEVSPGTVVANGATAAQLTFTARDANGNGVANQDVTIEVSGTDNVLSALGGKTDAMGVFLSSLKSKRAEKKLVKLRFGSNVLEGSVNFVAGPLDAASSALTVDPTIVPADGATLVSVKLKAQDANGNPLLNVPVTFTVDGTGNTLMMPNPNTNSISGLFEASFKSGVSGLKTVSLSVGAVVTATGVTFFPTWKRVLSEVVPTGRTLHAMAYDPARDVMVVFGGYNGSDKLNDTWTRDAAVGWSTGAAGVPQLPRSGHVMVFDPVLKSVVMFGGDTAVAGLSNSTHTLNKAGWSVLGTRKDPPARAFMAMAYDLKRETIVMSGGVTNSYFTDTWEFASNGKAWVEVTTASPPESAQHAMAFDSARNTTVLFGSADTSATWEYDGKKWTLAPTANAPAARFGFAMAYDSVRKKTVLFGGRARAGISLLNDTWEYDGSDWTKQTTPVSPPPLRNHAMAFDSKRGVTVLFGGETDGQTYVNETWEYGP
jgi:Bacterial Ig-like domain (group 1)